MPSPHRRLFAIIPAAGRSRRMGQPKLLLPFGETTVIGRLLRTLRAFEIPTYVLVRPDDELLKAEVEHADGIVVQPDEPPPQMRDSVEHLLRAVDEMHHPAPGDGWLLIPADHPLLLPQTLQQLINVWRQHGDGIILPTYDGQRGHPTLFAWPFAENVFGLPDDIGVNHLVRQRSELVVEVPVDDPTITLDLDTPEDYQRALAMVT